MMQNLSLFIDEKSRIFLKLAKHVWIGLFDAIVAVISDDLIGQILSAIIAMIPIWIIRRFATECCCNS